jgi:hypothetical protein
LKSFYSLGNIPHEKPISLAVSPLSPVSIQNLILAVLKSSIHYFTSSYNKSSTPVTPNNSKSLSTSSIYN